MAVKVQLKARAVLGGPLEDIYPLVRVEDILDWDSEIEDILSGVVKTTGDQTINGNKTFEGGSKFYNSSIPFYVRRQNNSAGVYAGAFFEKGTPGIAGVSNEGIGFYFKSRDTAGNMDHAGLIGARLAVATSGSEIGEIVLNPAYIGGTNDPYNKVGMRIRARSLSGNNLMADAYITGDMYTEAGESGTLGNKVATETHVTTANRDFTGLIGISKDMTTLATSFTNPHLALKASNNADNTGFVGMTFATSSSINYGFSVGAQRTTNGYGNFLIKSHFNSVAGINILSINSQTNLPTFETDLNIASGKKYQINGVNLSAADVGAATISHNHNGVYEPVITTLTVSKGGTGKSSITSNSYLKGNGTNALIERTYSEVKTDLSLNNVENKSSETIRGELTSANVITALKFTPANETNYYTKTESGNTFQAKGNYVTTNSSSKVNMELEFDSPKSIKNVSELKFHNNASLIYDSIANAIKFVFN